MRRHLLACGVTTTLVGMLVVSPLNAAHAADSGETRSYLVLYADGASLASGRAAVKAAGGTVAHENTAIGLAEVVSNNPSFVRDASAQRAVKGAARDRSVGAARPGMAPKFADERGEGDRTAVRPHSGTGPAKAAKGADGLTGYQWDMKQIDAQRADGRPSTSERGDGVLVGIIDTGVDGKHPDIAPNFSTALSRNFTVDMPDIDGACEYAGCVDPANVDHDGHGTHVAGTVASPLNGLGITGVAPEATIVNVRAGQDSGYFFLGPVVDALTYSADAGIDVVNMSFYVDPWLYNCPTAADYVSAPAGKPTAAELAEQRVIYDAMHEALAYAHSGGVTMVASAGNGHTDLAAPTRTDSSSPDYPGGTEYARTVTNDCLDLPAEGPNVMAVSAVGPSGIKSDYSNYGTGAISVAAPGGYFRDLQGTKAYRSPLNLIWAPYPEAIARANGEVTKGGGVPSNEFVARDCIKNVCAYYQGIQGTSMASPHVTGVAALVIGALGGDADPALVRSIVERSAADHACPSPATVDYTKVGRPASWNATCTGTPSYNSFYGHGLVDADAAVALARTYA